MKKMFRKMLSNLNIAAALVVAIVFAGVIGSASYALAALTATSAFTQTINAGTLSIDIVDENNSTVGSPSVALSAATFSFSCQSTTGTLGTSTQKIYVQNPDANDGAWSVTIAASNPTDAFVSAGTDLDFNDPTTSGCTDGGDADAYKGQMSLNATAGTLIAGNCLTCTTDNVSKGTYAQFSQNATDTITILTGAAEADDIGDWMLTGVAVTQTIPAEQPAAADYTISLTMTVGAA
ncbi:MAG: hypothetical protein V1928_01075 [Parcubacteria group bacterium]